MPRISAEARAVATAMQTGKLRPSSHLSAAERRAWRTLVAATPAGHLSERDRPLLESYVVLTIAQRELHKSLDAAAVLRIESIAKTLATLSNRLKLGPLASNPLAHMAGERDEPTKVAPLLGGLARVK